MEFSLFFVITPKNFFNVLVNIVVYRTYLPSTGRLANSVCFSVLEEYILHCVKSSLSFHLPFIYFFHHAQRLNYAHYTSSYTVSR